MSDTSFTALVVLGCAAFFGLYVAVHHYLPLLVECLLRKASGADETSSWQPYPRPQAALLFAFLAAAPGLYWLMTSWPALRGRVLYGIYVSLLVTLTLMLSALSRRFQRLVFRQQPVPENIARRFAFGITFFLVLTITLTYLSVHLV